jgi:hypothetical protein
VGRKEILGVGLLVRFGAGHEIENQLLLQAATLDFR